MSIINNNNTLSVTGDNTGILNFQSGGVTAFSVNSNGMYVKSVTTAQMAGLAAVNGTIVYNTTLSKFCVYVNGAWAQMTSVDTRNIRAIFGYGYQLSGSNVSITNLVSNTGVVGTDVTGVGTARNSLAAAGYGGDKAIFGYGSGPTAITNLVSSSGVVSTDTTGVGTARSSLAATSYGSSGQAIFGFGSGLTNITNLVSNTGVVATDTAGVGTARQRLAAAGYGGDKAIFGYGYSSGGASSLTNLVSNTGVVATDTTGVGTARGALAATGYGTDRAIFGYGEGASVTNLTNLVSNTGVVATDTAGVGTARRDLAAARFGTAGQAIFGYGTTFGDGSQVSTTNLVSNTGVVATNTTGVGTARHSLAASSYGS